VEGDANLPKWDIGKRYSVFHDRGFAVYDAGNTTEKARCVAAPN
jgi:hypothetical protein